MKMNWLKISCVAIALVFSAFSQASVITDVESINTKVNMWEHETWVHDITDVFTLGTAVSGTLSIEFWDDSKRDGLELASIIVGNIDLQDGALIYIPTTDWTGNLGVNSLASLNSSGMLSVDVWSIVGDFYIGNSTLKVITSSVPEPSSIILFGLGLLGLGGLRRLKAK
jgi:hypothetical protein